MHVLIVGPACSGLLYFAAGKEMGMEITGLTTGTDNLLLPEETRKQLESQLVTVASFDPDAFVGAACRLNKKRPIDGVLAGDELMVEHAAIVADVLGLPFISPNDVAGVRDKAEMRRRLHAAGVRAPKFATAANATDLEHVAAEIGFPAVIKPLKMAGSIGVARVNNTVELLAAYEDIVNDEGGWGQQLGTKVLIEEFLEGTEYIVDGCVNADGSIDVFEFCEYEFGPQPHFQIIGYTAHHMADMPQGEAMAAYTKEVVQALRIPVGPFHGEVMLTKDGPVLVEIANRLPGARVPTTAERATGVSLIKNALAAATSQPTPTPETPKARVAAYLNIVAPAEYLGKTYKKLEGIETIQNDSHTDEIVWEIRPGELIPPHIDERSWIVGICFHADSIEEAKAFRKKILETVHVVG